MTPEQQSLFDGNLDLVNRATRRWRRAYPDDHEDINQAARVGLWRAALAWDPGRGVRFATYAAHKIRGAVMDWLREEYHPRNGRRPKVLRAAVSIDAMREAMRAAGGRGEPACLAVEDGGRRRLELRDQVRGELARVPERTRKVLVGYFVRGLLMHEIAERVGLSESRVSQLITQTITYLQEVHREREARL